MPRHPLNQRAQRAKNSYLALAGSGEELCHRGSSLEPMPTGCRAQPRFLRVREVLEMTGMSRSFIYAQMAEGTLPKQIHLVPRTIVWNKRELVQ